MKINENQEMFKIPKKIFFGAAIDIKDEAKEILSFFKKNITTNRLIMHIILKNLLTLVLLIAGLFYIRYFL